MIVYLIRHGETAHNRLSLGLGREDVPLTPFGERQAAALGERLADTPIDRIISSPLQRAVRTAELVAGERGLAIECRPELTELDVGETEGRPFKEIAEHYGEFLARWRSDDSATARMPGGESLAEVAERVAPFTAALRTWDHEAVAIVSHNFVLRVMLCQLLGTELRHYRALSVGLASLTTLRTDGRRLSVEALNNRCHLDTLEFSDRSS